MDMDAHGIANTFTIMEGPDDIKVRLNDPSQHELQYILGVDGITINEIWITSEFDPLPGADITVKIYVAWEAQWE